MKLQYVALRKCSAILAIVTGDPASLSFSDYWPTCCLYLFIDYTASGSTTIQAIYKRTQESSEAGNMSDIKEDGFKVSDTRAVALQTLISRPARCCR